MIDTNKNEIKNTELKANSEKGIREREHISE
jgi:hypothetical protein